MKQYKFLLLFILGFLAACDSGYSPEKALQLKQQQSQQVTFFQKNQIPEKLSDWGLFYLNDGQLNLRSDAIPYHLNTPLFSDYAHKFRTIWIPENTKITIDKQGNFKFPTGSILSKTFYYPRENFKDEMLYAKQEDQAHSKGNSIDLNKYHLIETRLLIKQVTGWQALPYVWNKEQTEAVLEITGDSLNVHLSANSGSKKFTYIIPDANQCKACHAPNHTSGELEPIGPKFRHMNLDYQYNNKLRQNQIKHLKALGKLDNQYQGNLTNTDWRNRQNDLAKAARSYLDINCAHCHNPDGPADTSALYLDKHNTDKAHLGYCKPPVAAGKGSGNRAFDINPGKADDSILLFRMESNDPSIAMPELGRAIMHEEGAALIRQWINGLEGNCELTQ